MTRQKVVRREINPMTNQSLEQTVKKLLPKDHQTKLTPWLDYPEYHGQTIIWTWMAERSVDNMNEFFEDAAAFITAYLNRKQFHLYYWRIVDQSTSSELTIRVELAEVGLVKKLRQLMQH